MHKKLDGFGKIPVMLLQAEEPLRLDIHLYMPMNENIVLYRKKGQAITLNELLQLMKTPPSQIVSPSDQIEKAVSELSDSIIHSAKAREQVAGTIVSSFKTSDLNGTREILDQAAELVLRIIQKYKSMNSSEGFQEFLSELGKGKTPLDTHNRHVSALSVLIALTVGKPGPSMDEVSDIAFAGAVHDLCLDLIPKVYAEKHLSGDDLAMQSYKLFYEAGVTQSYRFHITEVLKQLREKNIPITDGAALCVQQHHENFDGTGIEAVQGNKIFRGARILRIADDMISLINDEKNPRTMLEAFKLLHKASEEGVRVLYDPDLLSAIGKLFALDDTNTAVS